jgi:dTDP-4-dehydrorhamnose reductase
LESDQPNPLSVYGATKLAGEQAIHRVGGKHLIFRTSWVYGPHGNNFLLTMLRLGRERDRLNIVNDQIGAPTTSLELADATRTIVDGVFSGRFGSPESWSGIYHMTCSGSTSWYGFAQEIFSHAHNLLNGRAPQVNPIPSSEYPTPAARPKNSVLSNAKLASTFKIELPAWQISLDWALRQVDKTNSQEI